MLFCRIIRQPVIKNITPIASPYIMNPTRDDIIDIVYSRFNVVETTQSTYALEFQITDTYYSDKFSDLARMLEGSRYICRLIEQNGGRYIIIQQYVPPKPGRIMRASWTPRILFGLVCIFVMVDGYYRTLQINQVTYVGEPIAMSMIYTLALLGMLGVHEAGHLIAAKAHRLKTTWPYFIPGLPIIGIPTFGAFIRSSGLTINRKILFDVAIAGPVAGAVVAIIVAVAGAWSAPLIDEERAAYLMSQGLLSEFQFGKPIIMHGALALFDKAGPDVVILTPVLWASWIGFLITFLNMLPAWQLDGGHMARTILSERLHRYATYASMGVLVLLNYWIMALLILVMSMRNPSATTLDSVTPLTRNRKWAYIGVVVLAILCAPIPSSILP